MFVRAIAALTSAGVLPRQNQLSNEQVKSEWIVEDQLPGDISNCPPTYPFWPTKEMIKQIISEIIDNRTRSLTPNREVTWIPLLNINPPINPGTAAWPEIEDMSECVRL